MRGLLLYALFLMSGVAVGDGDKANFVAQSSAFRRCSTGALITIVGVGSEHQKVERHSGPPVECVDGSRPVDGPVQDGPA